MSAPGPYLLIIPDERPISMNKFYAGNHWKMREEEALRVHALVRACRHDDDFPGYGTTRVSIAITAYFDKRPLDPDNIVGKLYIDGLVGWMIKDDSRRYVKSVTLTSEIDRKYPRLEILVTPEEQ